MAYNRGIVFFILFWALAIQGFGQQSRETFGKNRIQYRSFDWQYLSGENFDVYYYDNRKETARQALEFIEGEFDRITDIIGYSPYFKTKVFLYNSMIDLRQSNVGLNHMSFNISGETEFIKPYVEVANIGTVKEFKEELLTGITHLFLKEMMFGGNLKDIFQSALLLNLPDWFVDGAVLYVARGWTSEMDSYIRAFMRSHKSHKLTRYTDKDAALLGQSVWNFIAERYGKSSLSNILNYTRATRNEEKSVMITLGISFRQLMMEWEKYYVDLEVSTSKSYIQPDDSLRFSPKANKTTVFTTVKISPDAKYIAYAENDRGRYVVRVRSTESGREKVIFRSGSKVIKQRVDLNIPLLSWSDQHTLGVIGTHEGQYVFWLYDLSTKTKLPRNLEKFSNVRSIDFSGNGRLAILSADYEGQNDLFLLSTRRDRLRRLTNDIYDDLDPSFVPGSNKIIFSSNRVSDSLQERRQKNLSDTKDFYSLFLMDLDSASDQLKRITNTLSMDFAPKAIDENNFYYLSDQRGIVNLFRYNRKTGIYTQMTNFVSDIQRYDLNFTEYRFSFVLNKNMHQHIFVNKNFNLQQQVFTPVTRRKELQQVKSIQERRKTTEKKPMSIKELLNARMKESRAQSDTVSRPSLDTVKINADTMAIGGQPGKKGGQPIKEEVNTDDYVFEDEAEKKAVPAEAFISKFIKARDKSRILGPYPYAPKFSTENLVTSLVVNPLWGFGVLLETQMNDILEDYRLYGGIQASMDTKSSDLYLEFQHLPKRLDFSVRFDRKTLRWETDPMGIYDSTLMFRYTLNKLEFGVAVPINDRFRVTLKPFAAIAGTTPFGRTDIFDVPPGQRPVTNYFAGFKSELVYDNSVNTGLNVIEGTRGKASFLHYQGLNNRANSFSQFSMDIRHYQKVYKQISFVARGFAGAFFGPSPKEYLFGGFENWLFYKSRYTGSTSHGEPNPLGVNGPNQDLLFIEYAASLRGFNYASLFGNKVMFLNAEFRLPLVQALSNAPITSNFFRNLQFISFFDVGTSWSGRPPFISNEGSVSYEVVKSGPFEARVKNFLNPWLYSYGVGMRTVILGYFVKFNLAWPVVDFTVGDPRLSVGIGLDF